MAPRGPKTAWADVSDSDKDEDDERSTKKLCREDVRTSNEDLAPLLDTTSYQHIQTPECSFEGRELCGKLNQIAFKKEDLQIPEVESASSVPSVASSVPSVNTHENELQRSTTVQWQPDRHDGELQRSTTVAWQPVMVVPVPIVPVPIVPFPIAHLQTPTCVSGESVDDEWPKQYEKRKEIVQRIKTEEKYGYDAMSRQRAEGKLGAAAPTTPNAKDSSITKRKWDAQIREWRGELKPFAPSP